MENRILIFHKNRILTFKKKYQKQTHHKMYIKKISKQSALEKLRSAFDTNLETTKSENLSINITNTIESDTFNTKTIKSKVLNTNTTESNILIINLFILYYEFLKHLSIRDLIMLSRTCSRLRTFLFDEKCCFYDSIETNFPKLLYILKNLQKSETFVDKIFNISGSMVSYLLYGKFPISKNISKLGYYFSGVDGKITFGDSETILDNTDSDDALNDGAFTCGFSFPYNADTLPHNIDLIVGHDKLNINFELQGNFNSKSHFCLPYYESHTLSMIYDRIPLSLFMKINTEFKSINDELMLFENINVHELHKNSTFLNYFGECDISCCKNIIICDLDKKKLDFLIHKDTMNGKLKMCNTRPQKICRIQEYLKRGFTPKQQEIVVEGSEYNFFLKSAPTATSYSATSYSATDYNTADSDIIIKKNKFEEPL